MALLGEWLREVWTAGRVLKDEDALSTYKIQTAHTIHMVKGAARSGPSTQAAAPQQLPTMQAGQNPHDPLTQLNGPMGFGLMAGFNPFQEMGLNPNDPNMVSLACYVGCGGRLRLFARWERSDRADRGLHSCTSSFCVGSVERRGIGENTPCRASGPVGRYGVSPSSHCPLTV